MKTTAEPEGAFEAAPARSAPAATGSLGGARHETGADVREGGVWTPAQKLKNDVLWSLAALALAAARPLPLAALRWLGRALGAGAHRLLPTARKTALDNLARAMPGVGDEVRRALARRCFVTMGELLAETVALMRSRGAPQPLALASESRLALEQARSEGRGVLFASAHLGPWERVAASLVAAGVPLVALARESYDPRFSRLYETLRKSTGVPCVWRSGRHAAAGILRTLRGGGVLGVPMDLRSRVASVEALFLGHPALTPVGPARIALRARAAVVVGTAAPAGAAPSADQGAADYIVTATRIPTFDLAADDRGALALTARINAELSRRILALPHAWVWMHPRWANEVGEE